MQNNGQKKGNMKTRKRQTVVNEILHRKQLETGCKLSMILNDRITKSYTQLAVKKFPLNI